MTRRATFRIVMDADTLRSRRLRAGLSQEALARLAGVALVTIARIENGRTIARPLTVARLAAALDAAPSLAEQARAKQPAA